MGWREQREVDFPRGVRFYPLDRGFGPQIHVQGGLSCARMDKKLSFNLNLFQELQVGDEKIHVIVSDGYRGARHPLARDLCMYRLGLFNMYLSDAFCTGNLKRSIESLFRRVKQGTQNRIQELMQVEKDERDWEKEDDEVESIHTIREDEWLPEMHSTVIAVKGNVVAVGGPGAFVVALVGSQGLKWLTPEDAGNVNVVEATKQPRDLFIVATLSLKKLAAHAIEEASRGDVVQTAEALSVLDPADKDSTVLVISTPLDPALAKSTCSPD
ncbi:hypothetical protein SELMODRAFT_418574 [Selaginella moellendorffii]|uniref:PPM-type phosphatase domain-containing protein n=1 Tax=Selaginella moellendorffii TaxID=88036 RepID=D8S650_SELML|nr:hypothetical protein SELMODRAFT_418574 [Selaginella moellendorffii]